MDDSDTVMSIAGTTSTSPPSNSKASLFDDCSPPLKANNNNTDTNSTSLSRACASSTEQDRLTPAQLRKLSNSFDITNTNHIKWLKAEIAIEALPTASDLTPHGQDQLFRLLTQKTSGPEKSLYVKNWLRLPPTSRSFETYQFLRYIEELSADDLGRMYNPKILNITISDGGIDMKVQIERSEPLSPHCYLYQNRYVITGEVLQHQGLGFNIRGSTEGLAWHTAFLWKGENFKWLRYGAEEDDRPMDSPQSLGMKDEDMIEVHVDLNVEGPCPVCHFDVNWIGTIVQQ